MKKGFIRTYTGNYVCVHDPDPETIDIEDLAHHLAGEGRWGNATCRPNPVAEHCVWVARIVAQLVPARYREWAVLCALLHDAHEAYIKDMMTPIKAMLGPTYKEMARKLDLAIFCKLKVSLPDREVAEAIDLADQYAAWCEAKMLLNPCKVDVMHGIEPPATLRELVGMERGLLAEMSFAKAKVTWKNEVLFALEKYHAAQ